MSKLDTATPGGAMSSEALFNREKKANSLWRKFCRNRAAAIGLVIVAFMVLIAVFYPLVDQQSPIVLDLKNKLLPPLSINILPIAILINSLATHFHKKTSLRLFSFFLYNKLANRSISPV